MRSQGTPKQAIIKKYTQGFFLSKVIFAKEGKFKRTEFIFAHK